MKYEGRKEGIHRYIQYICHYYVMGFKLVKVRLLIIVHRYKCFLSEVKFVSMEEGRLVR